MIGVTNLFALLCIASSPHPEASTPKRVVVSGDVVDSLGAPVVGAWITFTSMRGDGVDLRSFENYLGGNRGTATDARGRFKIQPYPGPIYVVAVRGDGSIAGRAVPLDAASSRGPVHLRFEDGASIAGRVVAEDGKPVAGVAVRAFPEPSRTAPPGGASFGVAVSGDDGSFEIAGLHVGGYRIYASGQGRWCACGYWDGLKVVTGQPFLVLPVTPTALLRARLSFDVPEHQADPEIVTVITVPTTRVFDASAKEFELAITRPWHELPVFVVSKGLAPDARRISFKQGDVVDLGEIVLGKGRVARGRVLDPEGRPLAGASLQVGYEYYAIRDVLAVTGADGRFVAPLTPLGDAPVRVEHPRFGRMEGLLPAASASVDLRFVAGANVRVQVEDIDGSPMEGVSISARGRSTGLCFSTATGACLLIGLKEGEYTLDVSGGRGTGVARPHTRQLRLNAVVGPWQEIRFRYPRSESRLRTRVLSPDGTFANAAVVILPGEVPATVALDGERLLDLPRFMTGIDLEHPVENLAPDRYTVVAIEYSHRPGCGLQVVELKDGADEVVTVTLSHDERLCGRAGRRPAPRTGR
jgi:protocatechuate 3,4-dioxygenase beta subunit